jgi:hypothetical protein
VVGLFALALLVIAVPGWAAPEQDRTNPPKKDESSKAPPAPAVEDDPAFERYVDIDQLAEAWEDLDAATLADIGLQLAEGERVLLRSHKGVTAAQVLSAAARIAAEKRDTKTLQRLARAAEAQKRDELAEQVRAALKLAKASRAAPALKVQLDQANLDDLAALKATLEQISAAKLSGDTAMLDLIVKESRTMQVTEAQRKTVLKAASEARAALKDSKSDDVASALNKLAGISRDRPAMKDEELAATMEKVRPRPGALYRLRGPIVRRSDLLDITYKATPKGFLVVRGEGGFESGDVIVKVGSVYCGTRNANLDALLQRAHRARNFKVVVRQQDGNLATLDVPVEDDSEETSDDQDN